MKSWPYYGDNKFTLKNSLFGTAKITKNASLDKYCNSGYDISFDMRRSFWMWNSSEISKNVTVLFTDMSLSLHIDNKKKDISILGKSQMQWLHDTTLTAEAEESILPKHNNPYSLCLGNISITFSVDFVKETGTNGYLYGFSVDCDSVDVHDILDIHKHFMRKHNVK